MMSRMRAVKMRVGDFAEREARTVTRILGCKRNEDESDDENENLLYRKVTEIRT